MAWPVDMSLTSGGTSSLPKEKSLPEFDASDALEIVFSKAAACLSSMTGSVRPALELMAGSRDTHAAGHLRTRLGPSENLRASLQAATTASNSGR